MNNVKYENEAVTKLLMAGKYNYSPKDLKRLERKIRAKRAGKKILKWFGIGACASYLLMFNTGYVVEGAVEAPQTTVQSSKQDQRENVYANYKDVTTGKIVGSHVFAGYVTGHKEGSNYTSNDHTNMFSCPISGYKVQTRGFAPQIYYDGGAQINVEIPVEPINRASNGFKSNKSVVTPRENKSAVREKSSAYRINWNNPRSIRDFYEHHNEPTGLSTLAMEANYLNKHPQALAHERANDTKLYRACVACGLIKHNNNNNHTYKDNDKYNNKDNDKHNNKDNDKYTYTLHNTEKQPVSHETNKKGYLILVAPVVLALGLIGWGLSKIRK